jgi:hypothetical protein
MASDNQNYVLVERILSAKLSSYSLRPHGAAVNPKPLVIARVRTVITIWIGAEPHPLLTRAYSALATESFIASTFRVS